MCHSDTTACDALTKTQRNESETDFLLNRYILLTPKGC